MLLKISKYNHWLSDEQSVKIVNLVSQKDVTLSVETASIVEQAIRDQAVNSIAIDLRNQLRESGILIPAEVDELTVMSTKYRRGRFSNATLGLTVVPTLDCNFACPYCYEDKRSGRMSEEVVSQIKKYVEQRIADTQVLRLMWYGGEPLMCRDTIYSLTTYLKSLADARGVAFKPSMVTNGYLLSNEIAKRLKSLCEWETIQITLDGVGDSHDKKRPLKSGVGTFETVYKNLLSASEFLPIVLRMNVDLLNASSCSNLLEKLALEGDPSKLVVYFSPIHPYGDGCRDISDSSDVALLDNITFSEIELSLKKRASDLGFKLPNKPTNRSYSVCQAVSTHSIIIEPDGNLQRCWTEVGQKRTMIGHISQAVSLNEENSLRWLTYDPTQNEPCKSCDVLPECFGGCPQRHLDGRPIEMICASIRWQTLKTLGEKYKMLPKVMPQEQVIKAKRVIRLIPI